MTDDGSLHVSRWGHGRSVLLIHGGPQGGPAGGEALWSAQRPLAADGWELVVPDRPGHGRSPSRGPEVIEEEALWVAQLLGDGMHLVGHSYGACISLAAAGLAPGAVRSLTLIEPPAYSAAPENPDVSAARAQMRDALREEMPPRDRYLAFARLAGIPDELTARYDEATRARMGHGLSIMRPPWEWDAGPAIDSVARARPPFLAVTGGWSPSMEAIADALATRLEGEHAVIPTGHHLPQLHPAFNELLGRFLASAEAQRSR